MKNNIDCADDAQIKIESATQISPKKNTNKGGKNNDLGTQKDGDAESGRNLEHDLAKYICKTMGVSMNQLYNKINSYFS